MITRILAAIVGLAIILPVILFGGSLGIELMVPLFGLIALHEFAAMAFGDRRWWAFGGLVVGAGSVYASLVYAPAEFHGLTIVSAVLFSFLYVLVRPGGTTQGAADLAGRLILGTIWMGGFLAFLPLLRRMDQGVTWIFLALAIPWLGDTGAYFAGRAFGKHKLYELISPKKTIEGYVGGIITATIGVFVIRSLSLSVLSPLDCVLIGLGIGTLAVIGDLAESLLKRAFGVKDSGKIMPGHGGLLDRIDSLLFVLPPLYGYALWVLSR
jgi:phosphatidate cytidylyltransferase